MEAKKPALADEDEVETKPSDEALYSPAVNTAIINLTAEDMPIKFTISCGNVAQPPACAIVELSKREL